MPYSRIVVCSALFGVAILGCQRARKLSEISEPSKAFTIEEVLLDGKPQPYPSNKIILPSGKSYAFSLLLARKEGQTSAEAGTIKLMQPERDYFVTVQSATFRGEKKPGNKIRFEFSLKVPSGQSGDALLQIRDHSNVMIAELSCILASDR